MRVALRAAANGKIVCADNAGDNPLIANRDAVGQWEEFDVLVEVNGAWVPFDPPPAPPTPPVPPVIPQPPTLQPYNTWEGSAKDWFSQLVYGKPFGQATLLALEPVLNANGWLLTPPNAVGDRTKVLYPQGVWTRVGFGEGHWVWVEQSDK